MTRKCLHPSPRRNPPPHSSTPGPQVPISSYKPTYNPDNPSGPNGLPPSTHQPGQIAHPNMKLGVDSWRNGLCDFGDVPTCCTGFWCPCILYGQTQYRLAQKSDRKDPTDMLGYKTMNGNCLLFTVGCGFQCKLDICSHFRDILADNLKRGVCLVPAYAYPQDLRHSWLDDIRHARFLLLLLLYAYGQRAGGSRPRRRGQKECWANPGKYNALHLTSGYE